MLSRIQNLEATPRARNTYTIRNNGNVEDTQTLYITSGVAYERQVEKLFEDVIETAKKMPEVFGENFDCDVRINVVKDHEGFYKGYGFVWLSRPEIYHALLGNNPDGSPRWEDSYSPEFSTDQSWGDIVDEELFTRKPLPPILELKKFSYDEHQENHVKNSQKEGVISISPAFINPDNLVTTMFAKDVLFARDTPNDREFLHKIFAPYSKQNPAYPKIIIKKPRNSKDTYNAIIKFEPNTYDAQFALLMTRKFRVTDNKRDFLITTFYDKLSKK